MNILFITPRIPYPPYRGDKLRIYHVAGILRRKHAVKIFSFYSSDDQLQDRDKLRAEGYDIEAVSLPTSKSITNTAMAAFSSLPFQVAYYKSPEMMDAIRKELASKQYDVVYFHLIRNLQYIDAAEGSGACTILDMADAISLYLNRYASILKNPLKKIAVRWEQKKISRYENEAVRFDKVTVISNADHEYLKEKHPELDVERLRIGVDLEYFKPDPSVEYTPHRIIFTGNMPYFPNYDAAIYFATEIFPLILKRYPDAKFYIVGQKPPKSVQALASENVIVTGFVEDIRKEYLLSAVNVAPIRFGAGTLNKLLEPIVLGVPSVASKMAAKGMPPQFKDCIAIADDPEEFSNAVCGIFENRDTLLNTIEQRRPEIVDYLSWESIVHEFEKNILSKMNGGCRPQNAG